MVRVASEDVNRTLYWHESSRPLTSLAFVAPLLLAYEAGVLWLGADAARNGADVWLRRSLDTLGFSQYFLLPAVLCAVLLGWHHVRREPWRVEGQVLVGMLLESTVLAMLLVGLAHALIASLAALSFTTPAARDLTVSLSTAQIVGYLGAGVYEELLFRLLLLPLALSITGALFEQRRTRWGVAVVLTSALFAAAHYEFELRIAGHTLWAPQGDAFAWPSFCFRFAAGAFFSLLLLVRGFGIAAGTHALYDILAAVGVMSHA